ncbi:VOC family protein [Clavibacter capsici]|uniref:Glyoxalase/bleomycin resistance/dioxygenase family protein n=1 Tax=Clavibacter capsici TaxID=1874630 RepID=A0AAE7CAS5_9MICO|nr:VOC family protein [Clavibacter capsici]ALD11588.1 glyoxalase [Clavibacter capsici]QIS43631.1 glyoxalase/bleomycin resistance/dioxygenase family protein [Clavibacter capsici]
MRIHRTITVFDAPDLAAESAFWAGLLGGEVDAEDDWHSVSVDGEWRLGFQLAPDFVPPVWPGDGPRQQMQLHLDLYVDDLDAGRERVLALGGTLVQPAADPTAPDRFDVYADPAGHPFCLCISSGDARA